VEQFGASTLKVKVCGITLPQDLARVASYNPWAIGVIIYPPSPRSITIQQLRALSVIPRGDVILVAVLVNPALSQIDEFVELGIDGVQLHGDESPDFCNSFKEKYPHLTLIKAISAKSISVVQEAYKYDNSVSYLLFDTPTPKRGGSGVTFDWELLKHYTGTKGFFLSGGITPDLIDKVVPFFHPQLIGFDVSSGVEAAPGVKDVESVRRLFEEIIKNTR